MKTLKNIGAIILLLMVTISCSKDSDESQGSILRRDTDQLSFGYKESKQTFTLRSNKSWSIDLNGADWLNIDSAQGKSTGDDVLVITVTAQRNLGAAREAIVTLKTDDKSADITVKQQEGSVRFGTAYFNNALTPNVNLQGTYLVIPFTRGGISESTPVQVTVSGVAANGINVSTFNADLFDEAGEIRIPLTGTPTQQGAVNFQVSLLGQVLNVATNVKPQGNTDPVGTVYLSQDFSLLVFGGDHLKNIAGVQIPTAQWVTIDSKRVLPDNPQYSSATANTDGSGDYFVTMHPSYVALRGLEGWSGAKVYERPGYVKIGTAASTDGYLASPKLNNISGWSDVKVKFKAARWNEETDKDATLRILVKNAGTSDGADIDIPLTTSLDDFEIIVEGATKETVIEFRAKNSAYKRFLLDDIHISKVIK